MKIIFYIVTIIFLWNVQTSQADKINKHERKGDEYHKAKFNIQESPSVMCGPICLWQISLAYKFKYSLSEIAFMIGTDSSKGSTMKGMVDAAKKMGLKARAVKTNIKSLTNESQIAILLLNKPGFGHYVIYDDIEKGKVRLLDGNQLRALTLEEFNSIWNGYAILIGEKESSIENNLYKYSGFAPQILGVIILAVVALLYSVKYLYIFVKQQRLS